MDATRFGEAGSRLRRRDRRQQDFTGLAECMLHVEGLTRRFGRLVAVNSLDFQLQEGEVVGLLGLNGAG